MDADVRREITTQLADAADCRELAVSRRRQDDGQAVQALLDDVLFARPPTVRPDPDEDRQENAGDRNQQPGDRRSSVIARD